MDSALLERQHSFRGKLPFTVQGASRAAEYTGFWIPEFALLLDCGLPTRVQPRAVLCTHTHVDHVAFLARNCMDRANTFNVFCHRQALAPLQSLLTANSQLRASSTRLCWNSSLSSGKLVTLDPSDGTVPLCAVHARGQTPSLSARPAKRARNEVPEIGEMHPEVPARCRELCVRAIALDHSVPTLGFVVSKSKRKLRQEFAGLPQTELNALRAGGAVLDAEVHDSMLAYICDCTSESAVKAIESMRGDMPRAIIVECTYIDDRHADEAARRKHVLWSRLRPVVEMNGNVQFVLVHFSKRYAGKNRVSLIEFAAQLPHNAYAFY